MDIATVGALVVIPAVMGLAILWGREIFLVNWDGAAMAAAIGKVETAAAPAVPEVPAAPLPTAPAVPEVPVPPAVPSPAKAEPRKEVLPPAERVAVVKVQTANVRVLPSKTAHVSGTVQAGTRLKVFTESFHVSRGLATGRRKPADRLGPP